MMESPLLTAWAAAMWRACWQGSLVVLAVWFICLVIPSMPARCRCWLWRLAILKFMAVLLLPTLVNLPLLPAPPIASPVPEVAVQIVRQQVPVRPIESVEIHPSRAVELPSLPAILAFLWIIGVGWSLARLLVAWQGARQLRKQSRVIEATPLIEQLAHQTRLYDLRTSPQLLETEGDGSPMLIGILRPAIVIPDETLRGLSPPELAVVLGHELAHIRRGDLLWNLAAAVVRAVFFFNPLVWLSQRRLNLAQEVAADELAILQQNHDPVSYGKLLVSVISKLGPSRLIPTMSMGTAGSVHTLTRRLVAMANIGRASRGIIVCCGVLLVATVLLGIVPWRLVAAEPKDTGDKRVADIKVPQGKNGQPKVSHTYVIEPPDVIEIVMPKVVPLPFNRAAVQSVTGQYLVGPDGTINLRKYGVVHIGGKTVADARIAIQNQLKQYLDSPDLSLDVVATNSKVYYIITQEGNSGDKVRRLPVTGNETVLDAISQINGLSQVSSKKIWIARPGPHGLQGQQILPIDWDAITQGAQTATNYQIRSGDRVYIATNGVTVKAANAKPVYCVRCRFVDAKGSVLFAPTLGLEDGKEGVVSDGSQTPFVVGFTTENRVKQPHIVVLSEGTVIHVSVVSEAGQEATGATLDVTVEQSKIGDVDTKKVDPKTAIQVPHIAFQKKRVIDFVKYGEVMTIPMAEKSASGNEPRIELILNPPGKEIEAPANWKTSPTEKPLPDPVQKAAYLSPAVSQLNR